MKSLSRKSLARAYLKTRAEKGDAHAARALAAALITGRQTRDLDFIIQEIGRELFSTQKELHASVTSAHELSVTLKKELQTLLKNRTGAEKVISTYQVDPALLGGFIAKTPVREIDASIATQLSTLKHLY